MNRPLSELPHDVESLQQMLAEQWTVIAEQSQKLTQKQDRIAYLEEQLRLLSQRHFGRRSEGHREQLELQLFNEAEVVADQAPVAEEPPPITVNGHQRPRRTPRQLPKDLPRVDVPHELSEAEQQCTACGQPLQRIGEEVSEQLAVIPQQYYVIRHIRGKYACSCQACIRTAALPAQPLPGSQASATLLAHTMVAKYHDGLPLYRQEAQAARVGLELPRAKLARWLIATAPLLQPLYNLLQDSLFGYDIVQTDDTGIQVLKEAGRSPSTSSYLWIRRGGSPEQPVVRVDYAPSKSGETAYGLLSECHGYVVCDGASNLKLSIARNNLLPVYCNDHARRKFAEILKSSPLREKARHWAAAKAIGYYKQLYRLERDIAELSPEQKRQQRQSRAGPLWDEFLAWARQIQNDGVHHRRTREALAYLLDHADGLRRYCEDGRLPISNIRSEHVAKTIAVARKNFLFADTPGGAHASAMIYSLLETAKANGQSVYQYLAVLLDTLPKATGLADYEALLPWNLNPTAVAQRYAELPKP
ncbi:MAG: IS66 family transposase [Gammaproteobacteria bacterium]|nr:IS66 family transposase [Gammaproteobacteria bacterium]